MNGNVMGKLMKSEATACVAEHTEPNNVDDIAQDRNGANQNERPFLVCKYLGKVFLERNIGSIAVIIKKFVIPYAIAVFLTYIKPMTNEAVQIMLIRRFWVNGFSSSLHLVIVFFYYTIQSRDC